MMLLGGSLGQLPITKTYDIARQYHAERRTLVEKNMSKAEKDKLAGLAMHVLRGSWSDTKNSMKRCELEKTPIGKEWFFLDGVEKEQAMAAYVIMVDQIHKGFTSHVDHRLRKMKYKEDKKKAHAEYKARLAAEQEEAKRAKEAEERKTKEAKEAEEKKAKETKEVREAKRAEAKKAKEIEEAKNAEKAMKAKEAEKAKHAKEAEEAKKAKEAGKAKKSKEKTPPIPAHVKESCVDEDPISKEELNVMCECVEATVPTDGCKKEKKEIATQTSKIDLNKSIRLLQHTKFVELKKRLEAENKRRKLVTRYVQTDISFFRRPNYEYIAALFNWRNCRLRAAMRMSLAPQLDKRYKRARDHFQENFRSIDPNIHYERMFYALSCLGYIENMPVADIEELFPFKLYMNDFTYFINRLSVKSKYQLMCEFVIVVIHMVPEFAEGNPADANMMRVADLVPYEEDDVDVDDIVPANETPLQKESRERRKMVKEDIAQIRAEYIQSVKAQIARGELPPNSKNEDWIKNHRQFHSPEDCDDSIEYFSNKVWELFKASTPDVWGREEILKWCEKTLKGTPFERKKKQ